MRINIYAEELTDRIEVISKTIDGVTFIGIRFYLYMPVTMDLQGGTRFEAKGPFIHREGDDDSSAVTFWGKPGVSVRNLMVQAITTFDADIAAGLETGENTGLHGTQGAVA
jgi:hypothetical protein